MKLPKLFRKKGQTDDDEEDFEDGPEEDAAPAGTEPRPSFMHDGASDPFGEDGEDFDDEDNDRPAGRKPLIFMAAGGVVLAVGILGGLGWWYFSLPDTPDTATPVAEESGGSSGTRVEIALPPASGAAASGASGTPAIADPGAPTSPEAATAEGAASATATGMPAMSRTAAVLPPSALTPPETGDLGPGQGVVVEAVARTAYAGVADQPRSERLRAEPLENLQEKVDGFDKPLPKAVGSERPMSSYARPSDVGGDVPRIAIVMTDIGLSRAAGIGAVGKIPAEVTIAVDPYAKDIDDWVVRARLSGHEVLLELPMESERFPMSDAGPLALNSGIQTEQNMLRLRQVMSRTSVYVGLVAVMGSKFNRADGQLRPLLTEIRDRGLLFVDGSEGRSAAPRIAVEIDLPRAVVDVVLDDDPTTGAIASNLARLEAVARQNGVAVGLARPYPSTVQRLALWAATLSEKGIALVPVTAIADAQRIN